MLPHTKTLLHLSLIPHVGPATVLKFVNPLAKTTQTLEKLYYYKINDFVHEFGISSRIARLLVHGLANKKNFDQELHLIEKYNITVSSFIDDDYPESLKQIYLPPLVIYFKGSPISNSVKRIAIVGSRKADGYAQECIKKLVPMLVQNGWEIVSGGAGGVDSMAHQETIVAGGKTITVFGSGLMQPYPPTNKELFRTIMRTGGTLLSPFSLRMMPHKGNFPARNRIISGLSSGCIVVQAATRSGALITAHFALDQGRQVFAIPGKINNELSDGCHKLIQQGAKLITNIDDILEEFGQTPIQQIPTIATRLKKTIHQREDPNKHPILAYLTTPTSIDELSYKTNLSLSDLQNQLFCLQLEGTVTQNHAGLWKAL